ncbi:MAG: hypothetical protein ACSHXD_15120 [Marinosulfonomonas sp.]
MNVLDPMNANIPDYSCWETHDLYRNVVVSDGRHRVILCRDAIQWIIQRRRRSVRPGQPAWDALSYCTTKSALVRLGAVQLLKNWLKAHKQSAASLVALKVQKPEDAVTTVKAALDVEWGMIS